LRLETIMHRNKSPSSRTRLCSHCAKEKAQR
jgi:hypothetical protein